MIFLLNGKQWFLVACTRLYKSLCWFVRPNVDHTAPASTAKLHYCSCPPSSPSPSSPLPTLPPWPWPSSLFTLHSQNPLPPFQALNIRLIRILNRMWRFAGKTSSGAEACRRRESSSITVSTNTPITTSLYTTRNITGESWGKASCRKRAAGTGTNSPGRRKNRISPFRPRRLSSDSWRRRNNRFGCSF